MTPCWCCYLIVEQQKQSLSSGEFNDSPQEVYHPDEYHPLPTPQNDFPSPLGEMEVYWMELGQKELHNAAWVVFTFSQSLVAL